MQLPGIIAFLILLQYEVSISYQDDGHFARELEILQESLERHFYSPQRRVEQDDDRIEEIADAIIREAERRVKRRELSKKDNSGRKSAHGNIDRSQHDVKAYVVGTKKHEVYKDSVSDKNNDITKVSSDTQSEDDDHIYKRGSKDDENNSDKEYQKRVKQQQKRHNIESKKENDLFGGNTDKDEVKISHGDNDQIATIKLDNSPDQQMKRTQTLQASNELFMEPEITDKKRNKSANAVHHQGNSPPQHKVISTNNKVDRSGLDQFTFIGIIVACCVAGISGIGLVSYCWYRLKTETKDAKNGSPTFKPNPQGGGDGKKTTDEEKLVRGAEVFHYLHAKKQMQQMEEPSLKSVHCSINESSDEEEDEDTVYECPGLAPPGDMKVVNPLFSDTESHYSDPPSLHSTPTPPSEEK